MKYSPLGRAGLTTGSNWLESEDELCVDNGVADEDEDAEVNEDEETASLEIELSLTDEKGVLLTRAAILPTRAFALRSKSSPSSSSTSYSKMST